MMTFETYLQKEKNLTLLFSLLNKYKDAILTEALSKNVKEQIQKQLLQITHWHAQKVYFDDKADEDEIKYALEFINDDIFPRFEKLTPYEALVITYFLVCNAKNYSENYNYDAPDIYNITDPIYQNSATDDESWEKYFMAAKIAANNKLGDNVKKFNDVDAFLSQYKDKVQKLSGTKLKGSKDPDDYKELTNKTQINSKCVVYEVKDDEDGLLACRNLFSHSWGITSDIWCLLHGSSKGDITAGKAKYYWKEYSKAKKYIAFYKYKDGWKVAAFSATKHKMPNGSHEWWDLADISKKDEFDVLDGISGKKIDTIKVKLSLKEDEMVAAAPPASDMVSGPKGTTAGDILGKHSHGSKGGFMSKDCNHIPKPLSLEPMKRTKKNKKQKIYLVTDAELDRNTILSLREVPEKTIASFIQKAHHERKEVEVDAIMYHPVSKKFFAKAKCDGRPFFSIFDFDADKQKFIPTDSRKYTAHEAEKKFIEILSMDGNSPSNKGSEDMRLWTVWKKHK